MPSVKPDVYLHLAQLESYLKDLESLRQKPATEFTPNSDTEVLAERRVYKAIQAALDLGISLNNQLGLGTPNTYKDVFINLHQKEIIDTNLMEKLVHMAGMRNIIAHEYASIDPNKIYTVIQTDYQDLISFAKAVNSFIPKSI